MQVENRKAGKERPTTDAHMSNDSLPSSSEAAAEQIQTASSLLSRVVPLNPLMEPVSHQPAPVQSNEKTLLQHCELAFLTTFWLWWLMFWFWKQRIISIERDQECYCNLVEKLLDHHWLTCCGCCSVLSSVWCFFFFFLFMNNCKACYEDLPFVELIYYCCLFLLCNIVVWVSFVSFGMLVFCVFTLILIMSLNLDSRNKVWFSFVPEMLVMTKSYLAVTSHVVIFFICCFQMPVSTQNCQASCNWILPIWDCFSQSKKRIYFTPPSSLISSLFISLMKW